VSEVNYWIGYAFIIFHDDIEMTIEKPDVGYLSNIMHAKKDLMKLPKNWITV